MLVLKLSGIQIQFDKWWFFFYIDDHYIKKYFYDSVRIGYVNLDPKNIQSANHSNQKGLYYLILQDYIY